MVQQGTWHHLVCVQAGGKYLLSPQSSQDALPSPTALRDLRDVWGSSTPPLTDSAGTPPRRSSSAHNWPGVDVDPEALILPSRSPRIQIPSADASTARTPDTIDTGASTPRSRLGQPPLEQPPPELGGEPAPLPLCPAMHRMACHVILLLYAVAIMHHAWQPSGSVTCADQLDVPVHSGSAYITNEAAEEQDQLGGGKASCQARNL